MELRSTSLRFTYIVHFLWRLLLMILGIFSRKGLQIFHYLFFTYLFIGFSFSFSLHHLLNRRCQEKYANPRGRDLAMVRTLALCQNAVSLAK